MAVQDLGEVGDTDRAGDRHGVQPADDGRLPRQQRAPFRGRRVSGQPGPNLPVFTLVVVLRAYLETTCPFEYNVGTGKLE